MNNQPEETRAVPARGPGGDASLSIQVLAGADIRIGPLKFRMSFQGGQKQKLLKAKWVRTPKETMDLASLSGGFSGTPFSFAAPEVINDFGLVLEEAGFTYEFVKSYFDFYLAVEKYGRLIISTWPEPQGRMVQFRLDINTVISMSDFPVVGDSAGESNSIRLDYFQVGVNTGGALRFGASFALHLAGREIAVALPSHENREMTRLGDSGGDDGDDGVKWLDINKDLGPVHLARAGFKMESGSVTVYLDAGIRLSILLLEVLGLYVSIPFVKEKSFQFGIEGITVSVSRPPLYISGGLYISKAGGMELYTGMLSVQYGKYQLAALGSYGKFEDGEVSLFIFLLLGVPLGGPPPFFITGLAAAFGYNRTIHLPADVKDVGSFPFVAAAMGNGPLKKDMSPAAVLKQMNTTIPPEKGQYFASVGIRFTSFGMIESFLLANVMFGKKLEISLLGLSTLAMPPKSGNDPFVYLQLALLAVIAPEDGLVSIQGALTSESYLLCRDCKVRGGFAIVMWFGDNPHSGDFVITLGGYKDGYLVEHYPKVDRLSIDWKISRELTCKASFYFALTPSCVMMGGALSLTYEQGRLKAWFHAYMEFFMQWSPFSYSFQVGISLGASFRWDFFPFYHTFSIELGASLALWGPPFGGKVHISWYIISFTISFGSGSPSPPPLNWNEFADAFLVKAAANGAREILTVRAVSGATQQKEDAASILYSAEYLTLEATTLIPCTSASFFDKDIPVKGRREALGIVPMDIPSYQSHLKITLCNSAGRPVEMECEIIQSNVPRALWDTAKPDPYSTDTLKKNQITGVRLRCSPAKPIGVLPPSGSYAVTELCRNEELKPHRFRWTAPAPVETRPYPKTTGEALDIIERTVVKSARREKFLSQLSSCYGVAPEDRVHMEAWGSGLEEILLSKPELRPIGARRHG